MTNLTALLERVQSRIEYDTNGGCWLWGGTINAKGYGRATIDGRRAPAHRFSWEAFRGNVPEGLQLDHLCRVRCCVNPDHLEPVTSRVNTMRGAGCFGVLGQHTKPRGERVYGAKLRADQVREIRRRYADGESIMDLGPAFGVDFSNIWKIVTRDTWAHV